MGDLDPVAALERRQEVILQRLRGLETVLQGLKATYKTSATPPVSSGSKSVKRSTGKPVDLVRNIFKPLYMDFQYLVVPFPFISFPHLLLMLLRIGLEIVG